MLPITTRFKALTANAPASDSFYFGKVLYGLIAFTILMIVLFLGMLQCNKLTGVVTFLSVAGASAAGGAALGFLFGLPRAEKYRFIDRDGTDHAGKDYSYGDNTNLEEVSDWLTKIIVGVSLIKLRTIIGWIDASAHSVQHAFQAGCTTQPYVSAYVLGYASIILYFLAGAGLCYIWARTNLTLLLTRSKISQLNLEKQQLITQLQSLANPALEEAGEQQHDPPETQNRGMIADSLHNFKNVVQSVYNAKPVKDPTDLQKGRWGGKPESGSYVLEAQYVPAQSVTGLYRLKLRIRHLDSTNTTPRQAAFFLHDTFPSEIVYATLENNLAEISLTAWEAFVAGARLEDGTELELDLNQVKGFPEGFYWKP